MRDVADRIVWVIVADGEKAMILRHDDPGGAPILSVVSEMETDNPPTHEQGADRPGRTFSSTSPARAAYADADWHDLAKDDFARAFMDRLNAAALARRFDEAIIVAPPATLGRLRPHYGASLKDRLKTEIVSDLTNHPVEEIERHVAGVLRG